LRSACENVRCLGSGTDRIQEGRRSVARRVYALEMGDVLE
jgi:hypothetical protein